MPTFRLPPSLSITAGIVSMTLLLFWMIDITVGITPDTRPTTQQIRQSVANNLSIQIANMLSTGETQALDNILKGVRELNEEVLLIEVISPTGTIISQSKKPNVLSSTINRNPISIPLFQGEQRLATIRMNFEIEEQAGFFSKFLTPSILTPGLIILLGGPFFYLYLRRVLQHLDPTKVIPGRVSSALDTLTEGVMIVDLNGRLMLVNDAFKQLHPSAKDITLGQKVEGISWLQNNSKVKQPWDTVLEQNTQVFQHIFDISLPEINNVSSKRRVQINASPVSDSDESLRGCIVTFQDITEQEKTNNLLLKTLTKLQSSQDEIKKKNKELTLLASYDQLTNLLNRRAFFEQGEKLFNEHKKNLSPLVCIMCDIDHFKSINDTYGHSVGDEAIKLVAQFLRDTVRPNDIVGRYGGEEFVIILPNCDEIVAERTAELIRLKIEQLAGKSVRSVKGLKFTCSFGLAPLDHECPSLSTLIDEADQALYLSKETGRNKISIYREKASTFI